MPSKTEEYLALAQRTANGLTRYWESWTDYLTTASRLYKYPFADQLMIYAQRPDATACADYDVWNNRMNRYVRRGSKGIALLDESSGFPRLHYVFDVSDTGVRRNSRDPDLWQYNDDLKQPVSEMLAATYGISGERVSQQLADVAGKLVADYWDNNGGDIRAIVDGSLLMDYDDAGVEIQFKSAAAISVTYTLLERCGFEPAGWFDKDDFQAVYNFSTPDSVYALGAAVSDMSREVLRQIERTVKTTIRRRNAERSQYEYEQQERDLLDRRGLPAPEPDFDPAPEAAGQIRQAAPDVPERPSPGAVQHDAPEREPVPAPDGSGADGREPDAADHGAASETDPGPGQGEPANGMGAAHEQPESAGRGTGADKQRFISQIMTSKSPVRSCEDVDEQALSYAEIKALCAGNPLIKEKMDLDVQVAKLKVLKADHQSQKFRLQDKLLTKFPADIQETNAYIAGVKADAQLAAAHPQGKEEFCGMVIKGVTYDEKKTAGERLVLACSELPNAEEKVIGSYRGFELSLRFDTFRSEYQAILKGQRKYTVPLGTDPLGNIIRLDNSLNSFPERITSAENELTTLHQQQAAAQIEVEKPFPQEEELAEKSARLAELNAQLDVDEKSHEPEQDEEEQEDAPRRPSVLAALEEKSDKPEPVKPFKSYLDKDGDAR